MLDYLKSYWLFKNRFCSIEHALKGDLDILYVTTLKKTKKDVDIENCFSTKTIAEATNKLYKNQAISLVINNEQVLTKSLSHEQTDGLNLINKAFPNINMNDFYYEIIHQGNTSFISICRKKYIDDIVKDYQDNNLNLISFSLGNSILSSTINFIKSSKVFTSNANISSHNNLITAIEHVEIDKEMRYDINGLGVDNIYLLSLSSALSNFLNNFTPTINFKDKKNTLLDTYKQSRFYNWFLKTGLIFILVLLLINFLFFNFYYNKVQALNGTSQINQTTKNEILKLNKAVSKTQKTVEDMLKSGSSKSAFYVDAIVNSLPESILLSEINYQPLEKRIKDDKSIELSLKTIIISGESSNSLQYSNWITLLENRVWVDKVIVEHYNDTKALSSNFRIKISLKP